MAAEGDFGSWEASREPAAPQVTLPAAADREIGACEARREPAAEQGNAFLAERTEIDEYPEASSLEEVRGLRDQRPSGSAQGVPSPKVQPYNGRTLAIKQMLLEEQLAKIQKGIYQAGPYSPIGRIMTVRQAELENEIAQVHEERNEAIRSLLSEEMSRSTANPEITGRPVTAPAQRGRWESQDVHSPEEAFGQQSSESSQTEPAPQQTSLRPQPPKKINPQGLRAKLDLSRRGQGGYINADILREIVDYGRQIFRQGMEYLDWAMKMLRGLGDQVGPHLRGIFNNITRGNRTTETTYSMGESIPQGPGDERFENSDAAKQEVRTALQRMRAGFRKMGVRVVWTQQSEPHATYDTTGEIVYYHPAGMLEEQEFFGSLLGVNLGTVSRLLIGEEFLHAIHFFNLRKRWLNSDRQLNFVEFVNEEHKKAFKDLKEAILSAPTENERKALLKAVRASYHIYFSRKKQVPDEKISLDTLLSEIETDKDKNKNVSQFMSEFIRQAAQLRRQGDISENVYSTVLKALRAFGNWLWESLATVRQTLPGAYRGEFGPTVQRMLEEIESTADLFSEGESLPPRVKKVVKAESEFLE